MSPLYACVVYPFCHSLNVFKISHWHFFSIGLHKSEAVHQSESLSAYLHSWWHLDGFGYFISSLSLHFLCLDSSWLTEVGSLECISHLTLQSFAGTLGYDKFPRGMPGERTFCDQWSSSKTDKASHRAAAAVYLCFSHRKSLWYYFFFFCKWDNTDFSSKLAHIW